MNEVTLQLYAPNNLTGPLSAARVVLPAAAGDLTVLPERAPTSLLLRNGEVKLLNADNVVEARYFVKGGVADVADNVCKVSSEYIKHDKDITLAEARRKWETAEDEAERDYFKMIAAAFEAEGKAK